jgi:mannose-6-phosphate isomerase-like protein (cupin superfamily)
MSTSTRRARSGSIWPARSSLNRVSSSSVIEGDGYAVGSIDDLGEGYGFRKIRRALGVEHFGVNALVLPPGVETGAHYHDEQQELYVVLSGTLEIHFGDGTSHRLGPGGLARVDPATQRRYTNPGDEDVVFVVVGAKDGYVGRDAHVPEGDQRVRGGM